MAVSSAGHPVSPGRYPNSAHAPWLVCPLPALSAPARALAVGSTAGLISCSSRSVVHSLCFFLLHLPSPFTPHSLWPWPPGTGCLESPAGGGVFLPQDPFHLLEQSSEAFAAPSRCPSLASSGLPTRTHAESRPGFSQLDSAQTLLGLNIRPCKTLPLRPLLPSCPCTSPSLIPRPSHSLTSSSLCISSSSASPAPVSHSGAAPRPTAPRWQGPRCVSP